MQSDEELAKAIEQLADAPDAPKGDAPKPDAAKPPPPPPSAEAPEAAEASSGADAGPSSGAKPSPDAPTGPAPLTGPDEDTPAVGKLLNTVIDDVKVDFAAWMLSGLGTLVSAMLGVALVIGGYLGGAFVLFGFIILGAVVAGDDGAAVGNLLGMVGWMGMMFGGIGLSGVIGAPITASIGRAVLSHLRTGEKLTPAAGFNTLTQDLVSVIGTSLITTTLVVFGICFFYIGGLVASFFLHFAPAAVVVHRVNPIRAVSLSVRAALAEPGWHLGVWGIGVLMFMVAGNIPFVGVMIATPIWWALTLRAYIAVYGQDEEPGLLA